MTDERSGNIACPHCGSVENTVKDSRGGAGDRIRRRRHCLKCRGRFTTIETILHAEKGPIAYKNIMRDSVLCALSDRDLTAELEKRLNR